MLAYDARGVMPFKYALPVMKSMHIEKGEIRCCALLFVVCLLFSNGDGGMVKIKLYNKTAVMKREIRKHVPSGTTIEEARRIMEANGFKCQLMERANFGEREESGPLLTDYVGIDFLYCDKERGGIFCDRRWQVAIVHKNGIVSDVLVSIGRICL